MIINIDESTLYATDTRKKSWGTPGKGLFLGNAQRLTSVNMVAAISSDGEYYFTINQGRNNGYTLLLFLVRLVRHLNRFKPNWRSKTVFLLDNASYHRSEFLKQCFLEMKISVNYLGPYQFSMAPIENFFSYVKARELNSENYRCNKR